MPTTEVELLQGTLDLLILKTLSLGPRHGAAVVRWLEQVTEGALVVEEGSLYPALHRLERKTWVSSEWGVSEHNRRVRFYALTPEGREQLLAQMEEFRRLVRLVTRVIAQSPGTAPR
ncbi:PadR family transcriptional regulator [Cystobacter ferrugineus]|uniref:PadR family transcriptional regulator n=1 Tax=Cystobacter ferrugineus TaxID=83449 RepID=A0A1L9BCE2_9BACT|nr:PadR family transcriptional regulator [Cystobacter ferrugineus]OJH39883.1 PadR family transcriptional regulator [Cystobacter ferrugineus]